ncbi:class I SAM-dependent methyltransferase [Oceanicaulis sp. LC35]|uniref:class I SAM-dependent methyltransferase n=1 Tax=Oceanicaulis sp. LC35 TaxID=3349635 RepID=UPI003F85DC6B
MTSGTLERSAAYWNKQAASEERWSVPVDAAAIARAREGDWSIILTPDKTVPRGWFPADLSDTRLLALAGSGGQQAPVLAAAGAQVTVFDLSEGQLSKDRQVADRDGLDLRIEQGDMADLSRFEDASFDLVVNPCSVCFVAEVEPVWREVSRVLRPGGRLMTGFINPLFFLFDHDTPGADRLQAQFPLPYDSNSPELRDRALALGVDEFSHSLDTLIGGQMRAGLHLIDMYEDNWPGADLAIDALTPLYIATLAQKPL